MSETFRFTPPPKPVQPPTSEQDVDEEPEEYNPRARLDYLNTVNPPKKKHPLLRALVVVIVLALLVGAGVFAYPRYFKKAPAATTANSKTATGQQKPTTSNEDKVATKHFDSNNFNLGFEYPEKWVVNDNAETARLTVTSPATNQKTASGATELVRTVMTIAPKGQNLTPFDKGSAQAVRASEKIKYTDPTTAQRAETFISFVQYSTTPAGSGMDGIYITGDNGYQKDQYIPKSDMTGGDLVVVVAFESCADSKCSGTPTSVALPNTVWDTSSFKNPILTMLKSLSVN